MAISRFSITSTAAQINASGGDATQGSSGGILLKNSGNETAWFAGTPADASPTNGTPLLPGETLSYTYAYLVSEAIYAATSGGATTVTVIA